MKMWKINRPEVIRRFGIKANKQPNKFHKIKTENDVSVSTLFLVSWFSTIFTIVLFLRLMNKTWFRNFKEQIGKWKRFKTFDNLSSDIAINFKENIVEEILVKRVVEIRYLTESWFSVMFQLVID